MAKEFTSVAPMLEMLENSERGIIR
ncbi:hypothetical protein VCRA2119O149_2880001 [Vibrio crassostreae]|nr:hypothetical protein VCRA2119O149_2880001 [Vibrio crassostreae]